METYKDILADFLRLIVILNYYLLKSIYRFFISPKMIDVSNEIVLITGSGHGIGRELSKQYAQLGCKVIGIDINKENNQQIYEEISANGGQFIPYICDVSDRKQVLELAEKIRKNIGFVSILVNNAAVVYALPMLDQTEEQIRKVFDVNLLAFYWLCQGFLPDMIKYNKGHIVSMCSVAGLFGMKKAISYSAAKFAIRGTMEGLADEVKHLHKNNEIKFTTIYPYFVNTGLANPTIRFSNLMNELNANEVASSIISAQRKGIQNISIPGHYLYSEALNRLLPDNCSEMVKQFLNVDINIETIN